MRKYTRTHARAIEKTAEEEEVELEEKEKQEVEAHKKKKKKKKPVTPGGSVVPGV